MHLFCMSQWEVTFIELRSNSIKRYKVTRGIPALSVSETKIFKSKEEATAQYNEWLQ